ncbi:MAG: DUF2946 family protein [Roseiarcus sp.]
MARRRVRSILPIFLIALMVQIFAPIGAIWAMTQAADPLAAAAICAHIDDSSAPTSDPAAPASSHHDCCPLCQFAHSGVAPLAPPPAPAARPAERHAPIAWSVVCAPARDSAPRLRIDRPAPLRPSPDP